MIIEVFLRPRDTHHPDDPGHLAMSWTVEATDRQPVSQFRSYAFRVTDLPKEFQRSDKWRDYLFENTVPGYIEEDLAMQDDAIYRPKQLKTKRWESETIQLQLLEAETHPRQEGRYSFNPTTHHCENCVTWVVSVVNRHLPDALLPVREGRIKLIAEQFE